MRYIFVYFAVFGLLACIQTKPCQAGAYSCETPALIEAVEQKIQDYANSIQVLNTVQKRKKDLKFKHIGAFEEVLPENFSEQDDFQTASTLISIKINQKKTDKDIMICRQILSEKRTPFYLIGYPENNRYIVHILNLSEDEDNYMSHKLDLELKQDEDENNNTADTHEPEPKETEAEDNNTAHTFDLEPKEAGIENNNAPHELKLREGKNE